MIRTIASALAAFALVSFAANAETAKVEAKEEKKEGAAVEKKAEKKAEKTEKKHSKKAEKTVAIPKTDAVK